MFLFQLSVPTMGKPHLLNLAEAGHAAFYRKGLNVELDVACNHANHEIS